MINPKKYVDLQKFNTMDVKYSEELQYALDESKKIAMAYRSQSIGIEHITIALLKYPNFSELQQLFDIFKINTVNLRTRLEELVDQNENKTDAPDENVKFNIQAENTLRRSFLLARDFRSEVVEAQHFILAVLRENGNEANSVVKMLLKRAGMTFDSLASEVRNASRQGGDAPMAAGGDDYDDDDDDYFDDDEDDKPSGKGGFAAKFKGFFKR